MCIRDRIFNRVSCTADVERLQQDLDTLITWSKKWQMLFNVSKCKFMHVGTMQFERQCLMNDQKLDVATQEKWFGSANFQLRKAYLKLSQQCQQAHNRGSRILGLLHRTIQNEHIDTISSLQVFGASSLGILCTCLVTSLHKIDKFLIEKVQGRFTKMISSVRPLSYEDWTRA